MSDLLTPEVTQALTALTLAGITAFAGSAWMKQRASLKTDLLFMIARAAVGFVYKNQVRAQKAASETGKLNDSQARSAAWNAVGLVQSEAKKLGLEKHPLIANDSLTHGLVQAAVAVAKSGRDLSAPGTSH